MRSVWPRSITCTGVEPSSAGLGSFNQRPTSFGFIKRERLSSSRSISTRARRTGADGDLPLLQFATARIENRDWRVVGEQLSVSCGNPNLLAIFSTATGSATFRAA